MHPGHRAISHTDLTAAGARFPLGHADASQRRIDEQAITENAVGYPTGFAVEQVAGDDLEIVVGRVSESASAVTVSKSPDARDVGLQLVVHLDVAVIIDGDPGALEPEVIGVRPPPDRQQYV